jgi:hypothetical protein
MNIVLKNSTKRRHKRKSGVVITSLFISAIFILGNNSSAITTEQTENLQLENNTMNDWYEVINCLCFIELHGSFIPERLSLAEMDLPLFLAIFSIYLLPEILNVLSYSIKDIFPLISNFIRYIAHIFPPMENFVQFFLQNYLLLGENIPIKHLSKSLICFGYYEIKTIGIMGKKESHAFYKQSKALILLGFDGIWIQGKNRGDFAVGSATCVIEL